MGKCHVVLGVNSCFLTRRYETPENWVSLIRELGFRCMSLDSDMLDPFFSGSPDYIRSFAERLRECAAEQGVEIADYLTGMASYRFFGLAHRDAEQRERMKEWFRGAIDIAAAAGASCAGGRCDAYSVEALEKDDILVERYRYVTDAYRELSVYAKEKGLESIYFEQMYVPSLKPYTMGETEQFISDLNCQKAGGVPIRPVLDTGHACGQSYGLAGDELSYVKWIERFGAACPVIHLQQTPSEKSEHLPFLRSGNGDIRPELVLKALKTSFEMSDTAPWRKVLEPSRRVLLLLEVIPSTRQTEEAIMNEMKESAQILSELIPEEGLWIDYPEKSNE